MIFVVRLIQLLNEILCVCRLHLGLALCMDLNKAWGCYDVFLKVSGVISLSRASFTIEKMKNKHFNKYILVPVTIKSKNTNKQINSCNFKISWVQQMILTAVIITPEIVFHSPVYVFSGSCIISWISLNRTYTACDLKALNALKLLF